MNAAILKNRGAEIGSTLPHDRCVVPMKPTFITQPAEARRNLFFDPKRMRAMTATCGGLEVGQRLSRPPLNQGIMDRMRLAGTWCLHPARRRSQAPRKVISNACRFQ